MTLDQYGHLFGDDLDDVADKWTSLFPGLGRNVPTDDEPEGKNTL